MDRLMSKSRIQLRYWTSRLGLPRPAFLVLVKFGILTLILYVSWTLTSSILPSRGFGHVQRPTPVAQARIADVNPKLVTFWGELLEALVAAQPDQTQVTPNHTFERADFDPTHKDHKLNHDIILNMTKPQISSLRTTHQTFLSSAQSLAPKLPYERGSQGIVVTTSPDLLGVTITSLMMLRRTGSRLPVEIFLSNATDHGRTYCNKALGAFGARCLNIEDYLSALPPSVSTPAPLLEKFQFKVFALLFSSFQSVLFLDADAFPVHSPDYLMRAEPFTSHGLVTFPDFWLPTVSPIFWSIALDSDKPTIPEVTEASRASESGIMLFDKKQHSDSLLVSVYYNLYGPRSYYWLQSQGAWGTGDKETFRLAAQVLGKPVWHVRAGPDFMSPDSVHDGSGIMQYDPEEDYALYKQEKRAAKNKRVEDKPEQEQGVKETRDPKDPKTGPRWLFIHTNRVKIDARRLLKTVLNAKDKDGKWMRLWGDESDPLIQAAGYDIEKVMWEELLRADCRQSYLEDCEQTQDFYDTVFGKING